MDKLYNKLYSIGLIIKGAYQNNFSNNKINMSLISGRG